LVIKDALVVADVVEVEFYAAPPIERDLTPFELSSFSSVGPSLGYVIKPEIAAVGEGSYGATQNDLPGQFDFFTHNSFDLSGFSFSNGTSFSSPRIAGVAALVRQANPSWRPEEVKSAIVTSAERLPGLASLSPMERGGGHVNTAGAIGLPLIVTPATMSWENVLINDVTEVERSLWLKNVSQQFQAVSLSLGLFANERVQAVEVFPEQFDLAPAETIDISLNTTVNRDIRNLKAFINRCRKNRYVNGEIKIKLLKENPRPVKSLTNTQIKNFERLQKKLLKKRLSLFGVEKQLTWVWCDPAPKYKQPSKICPPTIIASIIIH